MKRDSKSTKTVKKQKPSNEGLPTVPSTVHLAQEMGEGLGQRPLLQRRMPPWQDNTGKVNDPTRHLSVRS